MVYRSVTYVLVMLLGLWATDTYAQQLSSGTGKMDAAVRERVKTAKSLRVIVRYANAVDASAKNALTKVGGRIRREHKSLRAVTADVGVSGIDALLNDPKVLGLSLDAPVGSTALLDGQIETGLWLGETDVQAENPYAGAVAYDVHALRQTLGVAVTDVGRGVGVAIVDSGIAPTADLTGRVSAFYEF